MVWFLTTASRLKIPFLLLNATGLLLIEIVAPGIGSFV